MRKRKIVGLVVILALTVFEGGRTFAADGWTIPLNGVSLTTVPVNASVSISIGTGTVQTNLDAANATTNPDEAGKVLSQTAMITVGNTSGYTIYVSGDANLTGKNNKNHKIPSVETGKTLGNMDNEWGYYTVLGDTEANFNPNTNFKAMSSEQQNVGTGDATTSDATKTLTLFYGARVNNSIAEDFYGNTVALSVIAQPGAVATIVNTKFNNITTMQEMTYDLCKAAAVNDTAYLRDTRDGKSYWVTKMADTNCWMSQNLALDLSTATALTSETSAVSSSWAPGYDTEHISSSNPLSNGNTSTSYADTRSWNLGEYIIKDPTGTTACEANNTGLENCTEQFEPVRSRTPSIDPNFYQNNGVTYTDSEYDAHYLVGNYYQWNAATAGTGSSTAANYAASSSICPKGWIMPHISYRSGANFGNMLSKSGTSNAPTGTYGGNNYNVALSPLFYVRGGSINASSSPIFQYAGQTGSYWSPRVWTAGTTSYSLKFDASSLNAYEQQQQYEGGSVRCLFVVYSGSIQGS